MAGSGIDGLGSAVLNLASTIRDLGNEYYESNAAWEEFPLQVDLLQGKHKQLASQLERHGEDVGPVLREAEKLMRNEVKTLKKRRDREETTSCCEYLCGIQLLAKRRKGEIAFPKSIGYAIGDVIRAYDGINVEQLSHQQELDEISRLCASLKYRVCVSFDPSFGNPVAVQIGLSPDGLSESKKRAIEPITQQLALESTWSEELHQSASQVVLEFVCNNSFCQEHLCRLLQNPAWVMSTLQFLESTSLLDDSFWKENTIHDILPMFVAILGDKQHPEIQIQAAQTLRALVSHRGNWENILGTTGVLQQLVNLLSQVQNAEVQCNGANFFICCSYSHNDSESLRKLVQFPSLLPVLVECLADQRNSLLQRQVALALQNIATGADTPIRRQILDFPRLLETLVASLAECQNLDLRWDAAWAIANLACGDEDKETRERMVTFPMLLENLESCLAEFEHPNLQVQAAGALLKLAWTKDKYNLLLQIVAGGLARKQDPVVQEAATVGLVDLARKDDTNRDGIVNFPGLLGNLVKLLDDDVDSFLQTNAAKVLLNLACASDNRIKLKIVSFPPMLGKLVDSLKKRQNPGLQWRAAWTIANLGGEGADQTMKEQIANFPGLLNTLEISLDQDDNLSLRVWAASALIILGKAKDIAKLLRIIVVSLEGNQDPSSQKEAAGILEDLAREGDAVKDQILSCPGLLESLVKSLLDDVNCGLQSQAARALIILTWTEDTNKIRILSSPVLLESLVASLRKCHNSDLQYYAAWVISNLAACSGNDKETKNKIANFPGLLNNLEISLDQDDHPKLRLRATIALIHLAWTKDTNKLLQMLTESLERKEDPVLQEAAANGLADLARGDDVIEEQILSFPGLLETLVQSLDDDVNCGLQTQTARALVNLACTKDKARVRILSSPLLLGSLKASLRKSGNPKLQSYAAWAIANLAAADSDKARKEQFASIPALVDNLETSLDQDDNPNLRVRAAKALVSLDWTKDTSKLLRVLVALLEESQDPELQEAATNCLADLARGQNVIKEQILSFPALLQNLVKSLDDDVNRGVQTEAARALVNLACAKDISILSQTLISPRILESMVAALRKCHNPDAQNYAAWAIANLAAAGEEQEVMRKKIADFPGLLNDLEASLDQEDNPRLRVRAAKALMNLEWTQDIPKLLRTLAMSLEREEDPSLQESAAAGLSDLARKNDTTREQIVNFPGLLENLVKALDDDVNCGLQTQATRSIVNLATALDTSVRARILSIPSLLGSLVASLRKVENPSLQPYAAWAISNLARVSRDRVQIANFPELLDNLENALDEDYNPNLKLQAARALVNLAWTKDTPKLLQILAVTLFEGKCEPGLQEAAAGGLADLARADDATRDRIINFPGLLEKLVKSLDDGVDRNLRTEAASAIVSLTHTETTRIKVRILSFPRLLESSVALFRQDLTPGLELLAMMAVANLAGEGADQATREKIANYPGVLDHFESSLERQDLEIRVVSAVALVDLERTKDTSRLLAILAASLDGKEVFLQAAGAEGLANLARVGDDVIKDQILSFPGLVENLVKSLDAEAECDLQEDAARCLLNLASSQVASIKVKLLRSPELLKGLVSSLRKKENLGLQWRAAGAIGNLAGASSDDATREQIGSFPGLFENLENCLDQDDNQNLRMRAARALLNLGWTRDTSKLLQILAVPLEGQQDPSLQQAAAMGLAEAKIASLQLRD